jgi:methionyl-tRNA formyltransferase
VKEASMRIIFMASAGFACPSLERVLVDGKDDVVAVVTQPDRPKGRNLEWSACPVKSYLGSRAIPVLTPEKVNTPESLAALNQLKPDLLVVIAYGQLLRPALLSIPPRGCINVHGSLLPKYRGAAPIQWALARGERVTGVTTMHVNEQLDAGDMILKHEMLIDAGDTGGSLHDKLAAAGAELLSATLDLVRSGTASRLPQDEAQATFAPKLKKADGRIDWGWSAAILHNRVRAFNPWPTCFCEAPRDSGKFIKILETRVEAGGGKPGTVLDVTGEGPLVQAGDGAAIRLLKVQPEGRRSMSGAAFMRGHALTQGDQLG